MLLTLGQITLSAFALGLLLCAAFQDVRQRLIANRLSLLLLALGLVRHGLRAPDDWVALAGAVVAAAAVLAAGFGLWRCGALGGGDVKLLTAATLFVGLDGLPTLVIGTALAGGVLALAALLRSVLSPLSPWFHGRLMAPAIDTSGRSLPYAVAIAAGAALAIVPGLPLVLG